MLKVTSQDSGTLTLRLAGGVYLHLHRYASAELEDKYEPDLERFIKHGVKLTYKKVAVKSGLPKMEIYKSELSKGECKDGLKSEAEKIEETKNNGHKGDSKKK